MLLSVGALAMTLLVPTIGVLFSIFALVVSVRSTIKQRRSRSPIGTSVVGIVLSAVALVLAIAVTAVQLYFGSELSAYSECKKGAGTVSSEQQCVDQLKHAMESRLPFLNPGELQFPFVP
jgi:hypothetical protein